MTNMFNLKIYFKQFISIKNRIEESEEYLFLI